MIGSLENRLLFYEVNMKQQPTLPDILLTIFLMILIGIGLAITYSVEVLGCTVDRR